MTNAEMLNQDVVPITLSLLHTRLETMSKTMDWIVDNMGTAGEMRRTWEKFKGEIAEHGQIEKAAEALGLELEISRSECTSTVMHAWQKSMERH